MNTLNENDIETDQSKGDMLLKCERDFTFDENPLNEHTSYSFCAANNKIQNVHFSAINVGFY